MMGNLPPVRGGGEEQPREIEIHGLVGMEGEVDARERVREIRVYGQAGTGGDRELGTV